MNSNKILKLKSGEELIANVIKQENNLLFLNFPMVFKTLVIPDPYSGMQKEITVLRDWISYGNENEISIPEDYILTLTGADEDAIELYTKEIEKKMSDDSPKRKLKNYGEAKKDIQKELEDMLDEIEDSSTEDMSPKTTFGMIPINEDMFRELMKSLGNIEDGIDFEFDLTFPPEEINSDETTEDQLNHPDFGNRWTDWSSNPNEY